MQYRTYGKTGLRVSALGFGGMRLPEVGERVDREKTTAIVHRALEAGVTFFDTHYYYHRQESEAALGEALEGRRDQVVIQTKAPMYTPPTPEDTLRGRLETALTRLRTDYIDVYLNHMLNWERWCDPANGRAFLKLARQAQDEGLVRHVGFSSHDTPENVTKLIDTGEFECMVVQYNLLDLRNAEAIAHAAEQGMGVAVMGPVGGGRLAAPSPEIQSLLPGKTASTAELALRFVLSNPAVSVAMSGMNTIEMVEENARTASLDTPLTDAEREAVAAALEEKKRLSDLYCTGCNYCMPCPEGVAIPHIFSLMNTARLYGLTDWARRRYAPLGPDHRRGWLNASACIECGECEEKCPQNIPIIEQLKECHEGLSSEDPDE